MDLLFTFTNFYGKLRNYKGIPFWIFSPFRRVTRILANKVLPIYFNKKKFKREEVLHNCIISLTSFPARIDKVWLVIESLKRQYLSPHKIILWLSKEQFHGITHLPKKLLSLEDEMFSIRFVDEDIRSHKKFYYAFQEYPDYAIVTCDDDIFYHPDMLGILYDTSLKYPNCIIANTTKRILYDSNNDILPYNLWDKFIKPYDSKDLVQIGIGGVFYPSGCFDNNVLNKKDFLKVAPFADDLWLNFAARTNSVKVVQSPLNILPLPVISDSPKLSTINCGSNRNDTQLKQIRDYSIELIGKDIYEND